MIEADQHVNARYDYLRDRHGKTNPQANGYRLGSFFKREQRVLLSALDKNHGPFLDIACGSGLMLEPLLAESRRVYGLDFNNDACIAARHNGIEILRGDAFRLPFANETIGQIVNCQFLNQQPPEHARQFITESARVLKRGGQLIILWRHARSLIHVTSHFAFTLIDRFTGQPPFPQYEHPIEEVKAFAKEAGLEARHEAVTMPFLKPDTLPAKSLPAGIVGASFLIVLKKP